jgi:hypothetical protein
VKPTKGNGFVNEYQTKETDGTTFDAYPVCEGESLL